MTRFGDEVICKAFMEHRCEISECWHAEPHEHSGEDCDPFHKCLAVDGGKECISVDRCFIITKKYEDIWQEGH